ncbi:MAG: hypothetical protein DRP68_07190, partial [Candidatus Omnitrophota bacterium]
AVGVDMNNAIKIVEEDLKRPLTDKIIRISAGGALLEAIAVGVKNMPNVKAILDGGKFLTKQGKLSVLKNLKNDGGRKDRILIPPEDREINGVGVLGGNVQKQKAPLLLMQILRLLLLLPFYLLHSSGRGYIIILKINNTIPKKIIAPLRGGESFTKTSFRILADKHTTDKLRNPLAIRSLRLLWKKLFVSTQVLNYLFNIGRHGKQTLTYLYKSVKENIFIIVNNLSFILPSIRGLRQASLSPGGAASIYENNNRPGSISFLRGGPLRGWWHPPAGHDIDGRIGFTVDEKDGGRNIPEEKLFDEKWVFENLDKIKIEKMLREIDIEKILESKDRDYRLKVYLAAVLLLIQKEFPFLGSYWYKRIIEKITGEDEDYEGAYFSKECFSLYGDGSRPTANFCFPIEYVRKRGNRKFLGSLAHEVTHNIIWNAIYYSGSLHEDFRISEEFISDLGAYFVYEYMGWKETIESDLKELSRYKEETHRVAREELNNLLQDLKGYPIVWKNLFRIATDIYFSNPNISFKNLVEEVKRRYKENSLPDGGRIEGRRILQVALDVTEIDEAIEIGKQALKGGANWLEAGTLLIMKHGTEKAIKRLREKFPHTVIYACLKAVDMGDAMVELAVEAGANVVAIYGEVDDGVIKSAVRKAREYKEKGKDARIMVDLGEEIKDINRAIERAKDVEEMGVDYILYHRLKAAQERGERVVVKDVAKIVREVNIPVFVAAGLTPEEAAACFEVGAAGVIVGGYIIKSTDPYKATREVREAIDKVVPKPLEKVSYTEIAKKTINILLENLKRAKEGLEEQRQNIESYLELLYEVGKRSGKKLDARIELSKAKIRLLENNFRKELDKEEVDRDKIWHLFESTKQLYDSIVYLLEHKPRLLLIGSGISGIVATIVANWLARLDIQVDVSFVGDELIPSDFGKKDWDIVIAFT